MKEKFKALKTKIKEIWEDHSDEITLIGGFVLAAISAGLYGYGKGDVNGVKKGYAIGYKSAIDYVDNTFIENLGGEPIGWFKTKDDEYNEELIQSICVENPLFASEHDIKDYNIDSYGHAIVIYKKEETDGSQNNA